MASTATWNCNSGTSTGWTSGTNAYNLTNNTYANRNIPKNSADDSANAITLQSHTGSGAKLPTITKVEIGVEGYDQATTCQPRVAPLFGGTTQGSTYSLSPAFTTSDTDTTSWVDITLDAQAPVNWAWTDVTNLDFKVWGLNTFTADRQLYIDWTRIRVTYDDAPNPSGGGILSGTSLHTISFTRSTSGTATFSGSAVTRVFILAGSFVASGTATFSGAATYSSTSKYNYSSSGSSTFSGSAICLLDTGNYLYSSSGVATLSGTQISSIIILAPASGAAAINGQATEQIVVLYIASGLTTASGSSAFAINVLYSSSGSATISGTTINAIEIELSTAGGIILESSSLYEQERDFYYTSSGETTLEGATTRTIVLIATVVTTQIDTSGQAASSISFEYLTSGYVELSGTTTNSVDVDLSMSGEIQLVGAAISQLESIYLASGEAFTIGGAAFVITVIPIVVASDIVLSGSADVDIVFSYTASGQIIISGASDCYATDWALSTSGTLILSGASSPSVVVVFSVNGIIVLSNGALVEYTKIFVYSGDGSISLSGQVNRSEHVYVSKGKREEWPSIIIDAEDSNISVPVSITAAAGGITLDDDLAAIHGEHGAKLYVDDKTLESLLVDITIPDMTDPHTRMYFHLENFDAITKNSPVRFLTFVHGTDDVAYIDLYDLNNGYYGYRLTAKHNTSSVIINRSTQNIFAAHTNYEIELHWKASSTTGGFEFWIDNVSQFKVFNANNSIYPHIDHVKVGSLVSGLDDGAFYYADDLAIADLTTGNIGPYKFLRGSSTTLYIPAFATSGDSGATLSGTATRNVTRIVSTSGSISALGGSASTICMRGLASGVGTLSGSATISVDVELSTSGTATLSGSSITVRDRFFDGSGTATLSGSASTQRDRFFDGSGTVTLSGTSTTNVIVKPVGTGVSTLSGTATTLYSKVHVYTSSGTATLSGSSSTLNARNYSRTASGFTYLAGGSLWSISFNYSGSGSATASGSAIVNVNVIPVLVYGSAILSGSAIYVPGFVKLMIGGMSTAGTSSVLLIPTFEFLPTGYRIILTGGILGIPEFIADVIPISITSSGTSVHTISISRTMTGSITLSGSTSLDIDAGGVMLLSGHALYYSETVGHVYYPEIRDTVKITISGSSITLGVVIRSYSASGTMTLSGTSISISSMFVPSGAIRIGGAISSVVLNKTYVKSGKGTINLRGSASGVAFVVLEQSYYVYVVGGYAPAAINIYLFGNNVRYSFRILSGHFVGGPESAPSRIHKVLNPAPLSNRVREYIGS